MILPEGKGDLSRFKTQFSLSIHLMLTCFNALFTLIFNVKNQG